MRARLTTRIALVALVAAFASSLHAQTYPSRGLRIVVPFAPGGSTDIFERLIGERLAAALGQPVVIELASGQLEAILGSRGHPDGNGHRRPTPRRVRPKRPPIGKLRR